MKEDTSCHDGAVNEVACLPVPVSTKASISSKKAAAASKRALVAPIASFASDHATVTGVVLRCEHEMKLVNNQYINRARSWVLARRAPINCSSVPLFKTSELPLHMKSKINNICGVFPVNMFAVNNRSPAWIVKRTAMGMSYVAYSLHGNFSVIGDKRKIIFRGAVCPQAMCGVACELLNAPLDVICDAARIHLAVASSTLGRCINVDNGCVMEQMLRNRTWCQVTLRIQEFFNAVLFHIHDFPAFMRDIGMPYSGTEPDLQRDGMPVKGTVSVTRRGCVNLRIVWSGAGYEWRRNDTIKSWMRHLRHFLLMLC